MTLFAREPVPVVPSFHTDWPPPFCRLQSRHRLRPPSGSGSFAEKFNFLMSPGNHAILARSIAAVTRNRLCEPHRPASRRIQEGPAANTGEVGRKNNHPAFALGFTGFRCSGFAFSPLLDKKRILSLLTISHRTPWPIPYWSAQ